MKTLSCKQQHGPVDLSYQALDTQSDPEKQEVITSPLPSPSPSDPDLVTWNGPDDPENPKNWEMRKKWLMVFTVSTFSFITPLSSSMVAPSLAAIGTDLDIPAGFQQAVALSSEHQLF